MVDNPTAEAMRTAEEWANMWNSMNSGVYMLPEFIRAIQQDALASTPQADEGDVRLVMSWLEKGPYQIMDVFTRILMRRGQR